MPNFIREYCDGWKKAFSEFSPKGWSFVSFIVPLLAVPLAIKGAQMAGAAIKKEIKKRKK